MTVGNQCRHIRAVNCPHCIIVTSSNLVFHLRLMNRFSSLQETKNWNKDSLLLWNRWEQFVWKEKRRQRTLSRRWVWESEKGLFLLTFLMRDNYRMEVWIRAQIKKGGRGEPSYQGPGSVVKCGTSAPWRSAALQGAVEMGRCWEKWFSAETLCCTANGTNKKLRVLTPTLLSLPTPLWKLN